MNQTKSKKQIIRDSAKRFLAEQELVRSYLKGKIDKNSLNDKGIKFRMPI